MNTKFKHPFTVDADYFEKLKESVMSNIPGENLKKVGLKNVYTVPEDFFTTQYQQILDKKASPITSSFVAKRTLAWVSITAIACITAIIFIYPFFKSGELNSILSKEGEMIQSDISDIPPTHPEKVKTDSLLLKQK